MRSVWRFSGGWIAEDGDRFHWIREGKIHRTYYSLVSGVDDELWHQTYFVAEGRLLEKQEVQVFGGSSRTELQAIHDHLVEAGPGEAAQAERVIEAQNQRDLAHRREREARGRARYRSLTEGRGLKPSRALELLRERLEMNPDDETAALLLDALAGANEASLPLLESAVTGSDRTPPEAPPPQGRLAPLHQALLQHADAMERIDANGSASADYRSATWVAAAEVAERGK